MGSVLATTWRAVAACASGLADLMLPNVCAACGGATAAHGGLCDGCNVKLLELVATPYCRRCGASIGPNVPAGREGCTRCPTPMPRFDRIIRLGTYAPPLGPMLRQLKYHRNESMVRGLGGMLAQAVEVQCPEETFDLALPVPMHWRRRLFRGSDHARQLAKSLARQLEIPLGDELVRSRNTPQQAHLSRTARLQNIRGAFGVEFPATIQGAHVLLVDDVATTGATTNEAARTLLDAGASRVILAIVAKADPPRAYAEVPAGI